MVATLPKPKPKPRRRIPVRLHEDATYGRGPDFKIDAEAGIVYGVKVLGWESRNGRRYLREAVQPKLHLYEGVRVFIDHGDGPANEVRGMKDFFGQLHKPRVQEDGVYADFHYLTQHDYAPVFLESAQKFENSFGFSHNADGETERRGNEIVVVSLDEVRSVDLVTKPATTNGLRESEKMASVKYRTIFEGLEKTLDGAKRKFVKKLLEQDDLPMDEPDGDEGGDHRQLLLAAIAKLLDNDDDDSLKKADQIYKILKPKKETPAEEADDEDDAPADKKDDDSKEEAEDDEEKDDEKDDKKESVQVQLDRLKRKDAVRDLCESEKVTPSKSLLTALCAMESVADRKALLQEFKGVKPSKGRTDVTPSKDGKTTAGVGLTESETEFTDEARAKRAALLRN